MNDIHPKMITRLAERYIEEYNKGGPRRASVYAERMFSNNELKKLVNKRVKELAGAGKQ